MLVCEHSWKCTPEIYTPTKSQVGYISASLFREQTHLDLFLLNLARLYNVIAVDDVIIQSNFCVNTFRGSDLQGIKISVFPLLYLSSLQQYRAAWNN